jgi:VIT1/CCC1 family predicted Fe2+/Mn2+ transporter
MAQAPPAEGKPFIHPRDYHKETWHSASGAWLREAVFGVNDGLVATLGIVAGVTASHLGHLHVVLAALVSVVAAVVSMALGSYISTRSENDFYASEIRRERREIREMPEHEMQEIAEIYADYGFSPEEIAIFQRRFAANPELWLEFMLRDELGILQEHMDRPIANALTMAAAVFVGSMPPVLPYLFTATTATALRLAFVGSAAAAFALGVLKARISSGAWWRSGLQFLAVAMAAAFIGIGFGDLLPRLFHA